MSDVSQNQNTQNFNDDETTDNPGSSVLGGLSQELAKLGQYLDDADELFEGYKEEQKQMENTLRELSDQQKIIMSKLSINLGRKISSAKDLKQYLADKKKAKDL